MWCSTIISSDGEMVLAKAGNHPEYNLQTNQVLIDFNKKSCENVPNKIGFPERTGSPYEIEITLDENEKPFYKLIALNENVKNEEIHSVPEFAISISGYVIIDESRMGVIMGSEYLGYNKFVVIDIIQDKIIQVCAINEVESETKN